jgi:enediyne biosynthesis protein E4
MKAGFQSMFVRSKLRSIFYLAIAVFAVSACNNRKVFMELDAAESGIHFENKLTPTEDINIIDYLYFYNGGGVAVGDINGDSLPDLYFSGNQVKNKLYLNKGNLKFEDITQKAGVEGNSTWDTGSIMGDVNGDGLLDIYVCAVVGIKNMSGHNELFINNGDNTFTERSAEFGLDFETYSSSAAFLDYDRDGDLDLYLLNHAIHTPESFGHANLRTKRTYETGGKFLRNDGSQFVDVSAQAKIYGGVNGYGLGVSISDFNVDGYPDIYVGNDFHEDDYYYINNRDGSFNELGKQAFTSMSKFSMGNDVADINHDGYPDLITLDMLPEDEALLKRSVDEENITIQKLRTEKYGYNYQFPRNMLQINRGDGKFVETALMSNVAATDWSWSALFCDFDQDGHQDLFVANGIPRRPNDLDYIKYVSSNEVVNTIGTTKIVDQKALSLMPAGHARDYMFRGTGSYTFQDMSESWLPDRKNCSTAAAYADLDNDGDLDLIVNNIDEKPTLYINQTNSTSRYLKIKLSYQDNNKFGIGSKVYSYHDGIMQLKEMYTVRGFQSSSEPLIHFGYGIRENVDSLRVVWPNGKEQKLNSISTNQIITVVYQDNADSLSTTSAAPQSLLMFSLVTPAELGLDLVHREDAYTDFDRLKLLPYQQSDRGPATAVGDINNDGKADIFFGSSKFFPSKVYVQSDKGFVPLKDLAIERDSVKEEIDAIIDDFNGDKRSDLFVASGGADFYGQSNPLLDTYFEASEGGFRSIEIPDYFENASCVKAFDFDADGDKDIFVGNESTSDDFGNSPKSYLLKNEKGRFTPFQPQLFNELGMVTDAAPSDYNKDGLIDLIVVGEWMSPVFMKNNKGVFEREDVLQRQPLGGLWQSVSAFDIDGDSDTDYILGNWGLNSKFKASHDFPLRMYYNDFDKNGKTETILAIEKNKNYYPLDGLDMIASQMPALKKKFNSYHEFAGKTIDEVFNSSELKQSRMYEVHELASGYLRNEGGEFKFVPFDLPLQVAPIMAQLKYDFDTDGKEEILLGGNYFGVQPFHGRFGSFSGALIKSQDKILMGHLAGLDFFNKSIRQFNIIPIQEEKYLLVTVHNGPVQLYKLSK